MAGAAVEACTNRVLGPTPEEWLWTCAAAAKQYGPRPAALRRVLRQHGFWYGPRSLGPCFQPWALEGYPNDLTAKTLTFDGEVDELGVPKLPERYGGKRHPVTVAHLALGWHERWLMSGSDEARERSSRLVRWLLDHQEPWAGGGAWTVPMPENDYGLTPPWVGALVQAQGISALARGLALQPAWRREIMEALEAAERVLSLPVEQGGTYREDEFGPAYEEYPTTEPSLVLNGLIPALWALADLAVVRGGEGSTKQKFEAGAAALARRLARYDLGFWSCYCLHAPHAPNVASFYYHRTHISQLRALLMLRPDPQIQAVCDRWERCYLNPVARWRALAMKSTRRFRRGFAPVKALAAR